MTKLRREISLMQKDQIPRNNVVGIVLQLQSIPGSANNN